MAVKVEILNSELTKAIMSLRKYPIEKQKAVQKEMEKTAVRIHKLQVNKLWAYGRQAGKDYSKMVSDNKIDIKGNNVTVYNKHIAAEFFEEGTRPHRIRAKNYSNLFSFSEYVSPKYRQKGKWTSFGKEVNHPGTRPKPFFYGPVQAMIKPYLMNVKKLLNIK